jgi:hypothetical protein
MKKKEIINCAAIIFWKVKSISLKITFLYIYIFLFDNFLKGNKLCHYQIFLFDFLKDITFLYIYIFDLIIFFFWCCWFDNFNECK